MGASSHDILSVKCGLKMRERRRNWPRTSANKWRLFAGDPRAGRGIAKATAAIFRKCRDPQAVCSVVTATMVAA